MHRPHFNDDGGGAVGFFCLYVGNVKACELVRQGKAAALYRDGFSMPRKAELYKKLRYAFRLPFFFFC